MIEFAPAEILDLLPKGGRHTRTDTHEPVVELDSDSAIERATHYLIHEAPEMALGYGSDQGTYTIAARVREFGVSREVCFDLMAEHWNETKSNPPWPLEKLQFKVENAYRYATGYWGGRSAEADFEPVSLEILEPAKDAKRPKLYRVTYAEAAATALKQVGRPLVKGLLNQQSMTVLYGPSNCGKTFLMLDIAFHIAAGRAWQGRKVAQGPVLYIAAEGGRGVYARIAALKKHYDVADAPLDLVPCPVNLLSSKADIDAVIQLCKESETEHKAALRLIVIDTTSRALAGGDENASTDMGAYVKNIDRIRDATKAAIVNIHHSGKDLARGARGWSGLRAATDTEIEIAEGCVKVVKQRDMDVIADLRFKLESVPLGHGEDGDAVSSCVLRVVTGSEFQKIELSDAAAEMWEAFEMAAKNKLESDGQSILGWRRCSIAADEWESAYLLESLEKPRRWNGKKPGVSARQLRELRRCVVESGYAKKTDNNQWVAV